MLHVASDTEHRMLAVRHLSLLLNFRTHQAYISLRTGEFVYLEFGTKTDYGKYDYDRCQPS